MRADRQTDMHVDTQTLFIYWRQSTNVK